MGMCILSIGEFPLRDDKGPKGPLFSENIADYLSTAMSEADGFFDCIERVEAYLENTIDLVGRDDFYLNVLQSNRGSNFEQQLAFDYFDTEEDVFEKN